MKRIEWIVFVLLSLLATPMIFAVSDNLEDDGSDLQLRENPDLDSLYEAEIPIVALDKYPFLNTDPALLIANGENWSKVVAALSDPDSPDLRVVHIGDSHIQADVATGQTRRLLQQRFGSLGRGLIVPLKLCHTNEPTDYSIKSTSQFDTEKLVDRSWHMPVGFTGVAVSPRQSDFDLTISAQEAFERLYIYFNGSSLTASKALCDGSSVVYNSSCNRPGCLEIDLPFPCNELALTLHSFGNVDVYGAELISDDIGVAYHTIGINGATFTHYNRINDFGRSISMLEPQLIIISLGTNESFGRFIHDDFVRQVDALVSDLKRHNPDAALLLVTPSECQRKDRSKRKSAVYVPNTNVALVRSALIDYGSAHAVSVYDWYEAAGGEDSSSEWIKADLFSRDRIHYSLSGYHVAGTMLYEALVNHLLSDPQK